MSSIYPNLENMNGTPQRTRLNSRQRLVSEQIDGQRWRRGTFRQGVVVLIFIFFNKAIEFSRILANIQNQTDLLLI